MSNRYITLNLNQYFNNNGFGYKKNNVGDFSSKGFGSVFPADELPDSNSIALFNDIPFLFPSKEPNDNNNFELENQRIEIPNFRYKKVHILCAADTGSFIEKISVGNQSVKQVLKVGITDWSIKKPRFKEKIGIQFNKIYVKNREIPAIITIWHQTVDLTNTNEEINWIKFRDNPSVHIFSMTFEKLEGNEFEDKYYSK